MSEKEMYDTPCVGGPYRTITHTEDDTKERKLKDGKYIFQSGSGKRHGDTWVWHPFIRGRKA